MDELQQARQKIDAIDAQMAALFEQRMEAVAQVALFKPGDRVLHRKFGEGNVIEMRGSGADCRVVIEFAAYGQKEFAASIAPIVKVDD